MKRLVLFFSVLCVTVFFSVAASASVSNSSGDKYVLGSASYYSDGVSPVSLKDALTGKTDSKNLLVAQRPPKMKAPGSHPPGRNPKANAVNKNPNAPGHGKNPNVHSAGRNPNAKPLAGKGRRGAPGRP